MSDETNDVIHTMLFDKQDKCLDILSVSYSTIYAYIYKICFKEIISPTNFSFMKNDCKTR